MSISGFSSGKHTFINLLSRSNQKGAPSDTENAVKCMSSNDLDTPLSDDLAPSYYS